MGRMMLLSHNHGSVENHPKRKATFILEIHPSAFYVYIFFFLVSFGTQFTWKKDAGIPEPRKKKNLLLSIESWLVHEDPSSGL